ncbi:MAG: hypothetical protein Kapaf2KO_22580 [Candidatus Kapaibacteriales bacterium]
MLAISQVPGTISYQGVLTDNFGNPVSDGSYSVVFTIWDASTAGNQEWTETQSITTEDGIFNVELGSVQAFSTGTVDFNDQIWLQLAVEGNTLSPRIKFLSSAFSQNSAKVDGGTIDNSTIGGTTPASGTFTNFSASGTFALTGDDVQDNEVADNLTINGGTVNNTVIGGTTPAAGTFSSLRVTTGAAVGRVLTSDANGNATWQAASSGGGSSTYAEVVTLYLNWDAATNNTKDYIRWDQTSSEINTISGSNFLNKIASSNGYISKVKLTPLTNTTLGTVTVGLHRNKNTTASYEVSNTVNNSALTPVTFNFGSSNTFSEDDNLVLSIESTSWVDTDFTIEVLIIYTP